MTIFKIMNTAILIFLAIGAITIAYLMRDIIYTKEQKLYSKNGITFRKSNDKPFTGTSIAHTDVNRTSEDSKILGRAQGHWQGKIKTSYRQGRKTKVTVYAINTLLFLGILSPDFFPFTVRYYRTYAISHYKNGVKEGIEKTYYFGGDSLYYRANYKNGKKHGIQKEYYYQGRLFRSPQIKQLTQYIEGEWTGSTKSFKENGKMDEDYIHDHGTIISGTIVSKEEAYYTTRQWFENGSLVQQRKSKGYLDGEEDFMDGEVVEESWFSNGRIVQFKNDKIDLKENISTLQDRIQQNPKDIDAYFKWGRLLSKVAKILGNRPLWEESIEKYRKVIDSDPDFKNIYFYYAYAIIHLTDLDDNTDRYKTAIALLQTGRKKETEQQSSILELLGYALVESGRLKNDISLIDQSIDILQKSVELGNNSYNLACSYAIKGNKKNALKYLRQSRKDLNMTTQEILDDPSWKDYLNDDEFNQVFWSN